MSEQRGVEVILRDCDIAIEHRVNDPRSFVIRRYHRSPAVLMTQLAAPPLAAEAADARARGCSRDPKVRVVESGPARLRRAIADLTVDKIILKEVAEGKV